MSTIVDTPMESFIEIVLSKNSYFTLSDVMDELESQGIHSMDEGKVLKILRDYRDHGIITQYGSFFKVSDFI